MKFSNLTDIKNIFVFFAIFNFVSLFAQTEEPAYIENDSKPDSLVYNPRFFLGLGSGINNYTGFLGVSGEFVISPKSTFFIVAGTGGWGSKIGGGFALYPKGAPFKSCFSGGISLATGISEYELQLETVNYIDPIPVVMKLKPAPTLNLMYSYNFRLKKKSKFVLKTGLAIALVNEPYSILYTDDKLTDTSKAIMKILQPGGLIIGMDFLFGL